MPFSTSPLGLGLATLMREPSAKVQQELLRTAYDAGFRHFDVAPSYGLGAAEQALGRFLRTRPKNVTVATKVGIQARGRSGMMPLVLRPARAILRRFPALRGRATRTVGAAMHAQTDFSVAACTRSLENSLRVLGTDIIDLLLLHDVQPADAGGQELLDWLSAQKQRGTVRNFGLATSARAAQDIVTAHAKFFDAVQVASNVLAPASSVLPADAAPLRLTHSVLTPALRVVQRRIEADQAWAQRLCEHAGEDVTKNGALPRLLLAWALCENSQGVVLVGASSAEHIRTAREAIGAYSRERLSTTADFLRTSLAGAAAAQ